jgi:hypothetical protein
MLHAFLVVYLFAAVVSWFRPHWWAYWDTTWDDIKKKTMEDDDTRIRMGALPQRQANFVMAVVRLYVALVWPYEAIRFYLLRVLL